MRKLIMGSALAAGSLLLFASASVASAASPSLSYSASGNTPYSTLTISGSGFQPGESVHLFFGLNNASTTADDAGSFSGATLAVPNVPAGLYLIIAVGQTSGLPAFTYIWINNFYPVASPSGWYVTPGSTLTFSGTGFAPDELITISGPGGAAATTSADSSGAFSNAAPMIVPFSLRHSTGTYTVRGSGSGVSIPLTITVADLYPFASPSSWYALPGTPETFQGGGFGPNEGVSIFLAGSSTPLAHATADVNGSFSGAGPVSLPFGASPAQFRAVGDQSGASANVPITLAQFYPSLSPSAYYSAPGSFISLSGSGFAPNEIVDITAGSATSSVRADGTGAFTVSSLHLPPTPNVLLPVSAVGEMSGASANFSMAIGSYYSWMTLSNYWAQAGSALTLFGHNFAAGEPVSITSGGTEIATGTADGTGSFTIATQVPFAPPGAATLTATGGMSGATADATMTIAPTYTDFELGAYAGAPGTAVRFIGKGYLPNEQVLITTDRTASTSPILTLTTDGSGSFDDSSWSIPADWTEGNLTFTATSQHSFDTKSIVYYVTGH